MLQHTLAQFAFGIFCVAMFLIWVVGALYLLEIAEDRVLEWLRRRQDDKIIKNATAFRNDFR